MIDPVNISASPIQPITGGAGASGPAAATPAGGKDFKSFLLDSLNEVSNLQKQADEGQ